VEAKAATWPAAILFCVDSSAARNYLVCQNNANCFVVRDHGGQALAYVYFEDEPGRV
jgi:hypothetical protein